MSSTKNVHLCVGKLLKIFFFTIKVFAEEDFYHLCMNPKPIGHEEIMLIIKPPPSLIIDLGKFILYESVVSFSYITLYNKIPKY